MNQAVLTVLTEVAKEAKTEFGPVEQEMLGEAVKAMLHGRLGEAGRHAELVAESVAAKMAAAKIHG